ncbi:MAG: hypothetical protein AB1894_05740 [Chloroflexota bacterium]
MRKPGATPPTGSQLNTILTLFLILRLTIVLFYVQEGPFNVYTDYYYYYWTAQLSEQGYYPFVNMWYEYPPILAYLPQAIFWFTQRMLPMGDINSLGYEIFARLLGMVLVIFDAGSLVLLHGIGRRVWNMEKANWLAWVYASLSLPLFFLTYVHQVVAMFFMLLALYWFVEKKPGASAVALGLGIASKLTPAFLLAPAVRFLWPRWKRILQYGLLTVLVVGLVYLPFVTLGGGKWVAASFQALSKVNSYGTFWAILDGNWGPGTYGPLANRLDIAQAGHTHANPAVVPGWLASLPFILVYGWLFLQPVKRDDLRQFIWFATLTDLIFHLWSRGWSPHWAMMLIPLFLLSLPNRRGLGWSLFLTGTVFIEWPFLVVSGWHALAATFIMLRTAFFVWAAIYLARTLRSALKAEAGPAFDDRITSNV